MAEKAEKATVQQTAIPQEPAENLGTEQLLEGQENNAPPPVEQVPESDLGLDDLLEGQVEPEPPPEGRKSSSGATR